MTYICDHYACDRPKEDGITTLRIHSFNVKSRTSRSTRRTINARKPEALNGDKFSQTGRSTKRVRYVRCENFPWAKCPATNDRADDLTTTDIYILHHNRGSQSHLGTRHPNEAQTLGHKAVISFPAPTEFADTFVPIAARAKENDMKKAAGRLSHLSMRVSGSQRTAP